MPGTHPELHKSLTSVLEAHEKKLGYCPSKCSVHMYYRMMLFFFLREKYPRGGCKVDINGSMISLLELHSELWS